MAANFDRIFDGLYELGYEPRCIAEPSRASTRDRGDEFLADLVEQFPDRPIFGSGDIWTVEDIFAMLEFTGVHAVSVARTMHRQSLDLQAVRKRSWPAKHLAPTLPEQRDALLNRWSNWRWPCMVNEAHHE